jgi:hypothetical protein
MERLRHVQRKISDDLSLIPSTVRSHSSVSTDFIYPDDNFFSCESLTEKDEKNYSFNDLASFTRELFMLNYQEYWIVQQRFYTPHVSYEALARGCRVTKQRICGIIHDIEKKAPTIWSFIKRDKTHTETAKNSYKNQLDKKSCYQEELF